MFTDKKLLITGGTGSFGNAVLKRFANSDIGEIRVFSRDEKKQNDMRIAYSNPKIKYFLGDVRNFNSILTAMNGVDYVFHAAALKQVPSCEFFPVEAMNTNAMGTDNVCQAAIASNVKKIICLSTDKAVYPINAMGMSKALMEKIALSKSRGGNSGNTIICVTRYGNVMCSRGSAIPIFINQLQNNKQITITDPKMTRFMMSLESAIDLVMFAFKHAKGGETFVQKAPACTVALLAETLAEIFEKNLEVKEIGTRHGEKLFESLLTREEMGQATDMGDYYRVDLDGRDLNYDHYFTDGAVELTKAHDYNSHNTYRLNKDELKALLLKLDYVQKALKGEGSEEY